VQLESLKVYCDVARYGSFSQAAAANHLTQSAASQAVLQLERHLGVHLVDRSNRPLQLTEAGRIFFEGCKTLLDGYLELEAAIKARSQLEATVQVAAIYSVGLGDIRDYVERFLRERLRARVNLEYLHPDRVYEKVRAGTADLGLVSFPRRARDLVVLPWREEEMVLACPPGHPLAAPAGVRPRQFRGVRYVGFDKGLAVRREVDRFLRRHGVEVEVGLEFDNIENIKKAVEERAGVALLPAPTFQREVAAGSLVAVPLTGSRFVRPLAIIHRRNYPLGYSTRAFLDLLRSPAPAVSRSPLPRRRKR
jgi:DNA-binding transcriptional LysR family regulator